MSAFQSGFGLGMTAWNNAQSAQERQLERERQARLDARAQEVHDRNVKMWREEDQTKADIKDASATRETVAGTQTTAGDTKVFSQTPENAAAMQRLLANEAELTGAAPVQAPTTAMTGQMARGHQIGATAEGQNTGDARNQRVVDALIKNGQIERAATMESTALEQRAKRLGLNRAELEWANTQYNQRIGNYFATMKPGEAVAKIVSDTKLGGLEGWTAEATPNKDGKKTDIVATGPNGEKKTLLSFDESSKADILALRQRFAKVDDATQIGWISEQVKTEQAQANADREYELEKDEKGARAEYYRSAAGAKENTPPKSAYERMDEFDRQVLSGIQEDRKQIRGAILKAEAEGTTNPEGVRKLESQLAALSLRERKIQAKYATQAPADDPAGMRRPSPAPSGSPAGTSRVVVSAETQRARDSDRVAILQSELASAKARLASGDQSAAVDVESLTRELGRAEKTTSTRPAQAPASAPQPAVQPPQQTAMSRPKQPAPSQPTAQPQQGATMSMGDYMKNLTSALSGNSQAQINGIKQKLANGLALSGTEQVLARQAGLIRAR